MSDETTSPERINRVVQPKQIRCSEPTKQRSYHPCSREEVWETQAICTFFFFFYLCAVKRSTIKQRWCSCYVPHTISWRVKWWRRGLAVKAAFRKIHCLQIWNVQLGGVIFWKENKDCKKGISCQGNVWMLVRLQDLTLSTSWWVVNIFSVS